MTGLGQVMRTGGYATHFIGKWDAGHLSWCQTPAARGYDSFVGYLAHAIDYWTFEVDERVAEHMVVPGADSPQPFQRGEWHRGHAPDG